MRRALVLLLLLGLATFGQDEVRFRAIDVFVDAGDAALGAWQVEIKGGAGALIVGVEGGDGVFGKPPYYDPAALQGGRIVLASFTTAQGLKPGRIRVARLHMQETGAVEYTVKPVAGAAEGGKRIPIRVQLGRVR